jgi:GNAT superfamily N-acetyltransferase
MEAADLDRVDDIHVAAFRHEGPRPAFFRGRLEHLLATDPEGAFVAEADGELAGVAMATRRDGLWGLSLLAVDPATEARGIGTALTARTLEYARPGDARMILSSTDPRAQRVYARAGLMPRPALRAAGVVTAKPAPSPRVRAGGDADLGFCDDVDAVARGFRRRADLEFMLGMGSSLWIADGGDGRGYALAQPERLVTLAATDAATARDLLAQALAGAGQGEFDVSWLTGGQDWAYRTLFEAGLAVEPYGPIWVAGDVPPLANYLPNGALL